MDPFPPRMLLLEFSYTFFCLNLVNLVLSSLLRFVALVVLFFMALCRLAFYSQYLFLGLFLFHFTGVLFFLGGGGVRWGGVARGGGGDGGGAGFSWGWGGDGVGGGMHAEHCSSFISEFCSFWHFLGLRVFQSLPRSRDSKKERKGACVVQVLREQVK